MKHAFLFIIALCFMYFSHTHIGAVLLYPINIFIDVFIIGYGLWKLTE